MHFNNYTAFLAVSVIICSITISIERNKEMNNHNLSQWLIDVKTATGSKTVGQFITNDALDFTVVIDWQITDILSPNIAAFKKSVADFAAEITAAEEVKFLKSYPQAVSAGGFAHACQPLFAQGIDNVNWQTVETTLQQSIKQFYLMDLTQFGADIIGKLADDIYCFASIRDQKTNSLLGFIISSITPALPYGDIKVINVIIAPEEQERELEKILLSTLLKVIPQVKRLFTLTRPTNLKALMAYSACDFTYDTNPIQDANHEIATEYLSTMEYKTKNSDILQKKANNLIE